MNASVETLRRGGHEAVLLLTRGVDTAGVEVREQLQNERFDIVCIGAGLRVIPKQTPLFETIMNVVHAHAPDARLAFNTSPEDTAEAVRRVAASAQIQ